MVTLPQSFCLADLSVYLHTFFTDTMILQCFIHIWPLSHILKAFFLTFNNLFPIICILQTCLECARLDKLFYFKPLEWNNLTVPKLMEQKRVFWMLVINKFCNYSSKGPCDVLLVFVPVLCLCDFWESRGKISLLVYYKHITYSVKDSLDRDCN